MVCFFKAYPVLLIYIFSIDVDTCKKTCDNYCNIIYNTHNRKEKIIFNKVSRMSTVEEDTKHFNIVPIDDAILRSFAHERCSEEQCMTWKRNYWFIHCFAGFTEDKKIQCKCQVYGKSVKKSTYSNPDTFYSHIRINIQHNTWIKNNMNIDQIKQFYSKVKKIN